MVLVSIFFVICGLKQLLFYMALVVESSLTWHHNVS